MEQLQVTDLGLPSTASSMCNAQPVHRALLAWCAWLVTTASMCGGCNRRDGDEAGARPQPPPSTAHAAIAAPTPEQPSPAPVDERVFSRERTMMGTIIVITIVGESDQKAASSADDRAR